MASNSYIYMNYIYGIYQIGLHSGAAASLVHFLLFVHVHASYALVAEFCRREVRLRIQTCAISARGMIAEELYGAKAVPSEKENTDIV